jgi:hypothetical protein
VRKKTCSNCRYYTEGKCMIMICFGALGNRTDTVKRPDNSCRMHKPATPAPEAGRKEE